MAMAMASMFGNDFSDPNRGSSGSDSEQSGTEPTSEGHKKVQMCKKCRLHDQGEIPKKGHSRDCPYRDCSCSLCQVANDRNEIMAKQIATRRRCSKDRQDEMHRQQLVNDAVLQYETAAQAQMMFTNAGAFAGLYPSLGYSQFPELTQYTQHAVPTIYPTVSTFIPTQDYSMANLSLNNNHIDLQEMHGQISLAQIQQQLHYQQNHSMNQ